MWLPRTCLRLIDIGIEHLPADLALILVVDLHDLDVLLSVGDQFFLVLHHEVFPDPQLPDFFGLPHLNDHIIQDVEGLLDGLQSLEDVAILLSEQVEWVLGGVLRLKLIDCISKERPRSEAMICSLIPPSVMTLSKR